MIVGNGFSIESSLGEYGLQTNQPLTIIAYIVIS